MHRLSVLPTLALALLLNACSGGSSSSPPPPPADIAPMANAGPDQTVNEKTVVTLAGSGSDKEGAVSLQWTQTSGPNVTLSGASTASPSFTAPDVSGDQTLVFTLTVTDSAKQSASDTVSITVKDQPSANTPPTANAGPDQTVNEKTTVTLAGSGSDKEGPVTFSWAQTSGPTVTLSGANSATPSFTAPDVSTVQTLVFTLTVKDSAQQSATDSVSIKVNDVPGGGTDTPPTANAGPDQSVSEKTTAVLTGSGSDREGPVTFQWSQTAGPSVTLTNATSAVASFTAPDVSAATTLVFSLAVRDSAQQTATDSVTVTVTDTSGGSGGTGAPGDHYLFYFGPDSLHAIDPATPTATKTIEASGLLKDKFGQLPATAVFRTGNYHAQTHSVLYMRAHTVLYAKTDGHFYKVDARKTGSLTPVQVSNTSQLNDLCTDDMTETFAYATDFANLQNSQYVYLLSGPDKICGNSDDTWQMVRIGMGPSTSPIPAKRPVAPPLYDFANGAINGWLVHHAGSVSRCDAQFANCQTVAAASNLPKHVLDIGLNRHLMHIDAQLRVYDGNAHTLSGVVHSLPMHRTLTINQVVNTASELYFADGKTIYRASVTGNAPASVLHTETDNIQRMRLVGQHLVYTIGPDQTQKQMRSLAVTGGTPLTLGTTTGTDEFELWFARDGHAYYSVQNFAEMKWIIVAAGITDPQGNRSETPHAAWVGAVFPNTVDLSQSHAKTHFAPEKFIRLESTAGSLNSATLRVFDGASPGINLGTLPAGNDLLMTVCFGAWSEYNVLCTRLHQTSQMMKGAQTDVSFLNVTTANSLTHITTTADKDEAPVQ